MIKYFNYKETAEKHGYKITKSTILSIRPKYLNSNSEVSNWRDLANLIKNENTIIYSTKDLITQNIMAFDLDIQDFGLNSNLVPFKDTLQLFINTMADFGYHICFMYPTGSTFNKIIGIDEKTKKPIYNNKYVGFRFWIMLEELSINNTLIYNSLLDDINDFILPKIPFFNVNRIKLDPIFEKELIFGSANNTDDLLIFGQDKGFYIAPVLNLVKLETIDLSNDLGKTFKKSKSEFGKKQDELLSNYSSSDEYIKDCYLSNMEYFDKNTKGDYNDWIKLTRDLISKLVLVFNERDEDTIIDLLLSNDWFNHRKSHVNYFRNQIINKIEWAESTGFVKYNSNKMIKNYLTNPKWSVSNNSLRSQFKKEFIINGCYLNNDDRFLSELINDDAILKIIQAPTGSGKTTVIRDLLLNNLSETFYLFILPYREQIKQNSEVVNKYLDDNGNVGNIIVNIDESVMETDNKLVNLKQSIICTLNKSSKYISAIKEQYPDRKIVLIIDEGHDLVTSINYRFTEIKKLLNHIQDQSIQTRIITASVPQLMFHQYGYNTALTVNFKFEDQYKPVWNKKTIFNSTIQKEMETILNNTDENLIIFIDNKARLNELKNTFNKYTSAVLTADTAKMSVSNKDRIVLEKIKKGQDTQDVRILFITSSLKEGIDIKDLKNRTVITNSMSITDIIQVNGRMREFRTHDLIHVVEESQVINNITLNRKDYFDYNKLISDLEYDLFKNIKLVIDNLTKIKQNMSWSDEDLIKNIYNNNRVLKSSQLVSYYKKDSAFKISIISEMANEILENNLTITNIDNELIDLGWNVEWIDRNQFEKLNKVVGDKVNWLDVCKLLKDSNYLNDIDYLYAITDTKDNFILRSQGELSKISSHVNCPIVTEMILNNYPNIKMKDKNIQILFSNLLNNNQSEFYKKIINHFENNNITQVTSDDIKDMIKEFFTGDFARVNKFDKDIIVNDTDNFVKDPIEVFKNFIPLTEIKRVGRDKVHTYIIDRNFLTHFKTKI